ncbi:protein yellow-like isoform X2 [Lycorma delicatula]|uniref:protein yellow-like isoform X2 n=1 Tax=Lycorma delicatula TaxID=130591 RepID=UPI003F50DCD8
MGMLFPWFVSMWLVGNIQSSLTDADRIPINKNNNYNNKLKEVFSWKEIDFVFPNDFAREEAIASKEFIPANNLPLGLEIFEDKIFVSIPRWKSGVPCTLAVVNKNDNNKSPLLRPFPRWSWHKVGNCDGLTSVFRMSVDSCGRLWVLDSGSIDLLTTVHQICPAQIVVFDARTEQLLWKYKIPKEQSLEDSLFINIAVDVRNNDCNNAFAYAADVFRYGLLVYSWRENKSWRINHPHFYPDPLVCRYDLDGIVFRWTDGIFGLALSPINSKTGDRTLYFHPLSSYREFSVSTAILRNETRTKLERDSYNLVGEPRGNQNSHATASAMDRNGILYYNLVSLNAVGCWNSNNGPHTFKSQGIIEQNKETLNFPNDIKVDMEPNQNVWVLSNKLHKYLYRSLDPYDYNFRILMSSTKDAIKNTVCQPGVSIPPTKNSCINDF